jgi:murein DD-endopeptidase MepM/ murein hydrolase activator NlpD
MSPPAISPITRLLLAVLVIGGVVGGYLAYRSRGVRPARFARFLAWRQDPGAHPDWSIRAREVCGQALFQLPTDGFIGFLWGDSFRPGQRHQGIDIFSGTPAGETPVYAASDGFLTRLPEWRSAVIMRIPEDPLQPGRQIWVFYTHMADREGNSFIAPRFPAGTSEVPVQAGTLLGYQGDYSGDPNNPVGVHLHFSIVLDDGQGNFLNELQIRNTLDPSPYLGLDLNAETNTGEVAVCPET